MSNSSWYTEVRVGIVCGLSKLWKRVVTNGEHSKTKVLHIAFSFKLRATCVFYIKCTEQSCCTGFSIKVWSLPSLWSPWTLKPQPDLALSFLQKALCVEHVPREACLWVKERESLWKAATERENNPHTETSRRKSQKYVMRKSCSKDPLWVP